MKRGTRMKPLKRPFKFEYFILVLFALGSNACRVGNSPKQASTSSSTPQADAATQATPAKYNGYYETEVFSLKFCAVTVDTVTQENVTNCVETNVNQTPALVTGLFTNPTIYCYECSEDFPKGEVVISGINSDSSYFSTTPNSDGSFVLDAAYDPEAYWVDSCTLQQGFYVEGIITQGNQSSNTINEKSISGRMSTYFEFDYLFDGCGTALTEMLTCMGDATTCGGTDDATNSTIQASVISLFEPYISNQVITESDIPNVKMLAYAVQYQ